jgi:GTPase SAR1 family protein
MGVTGSKIKSGKKGTKGGDTPQTRRATVGSKPEGITADKVYKLVMLGDGGVGKTGMH